MDQDLIIYQLDIRTYVDSSGNGQGDFKGALQKLDYIQSLGANTLAILPLSDPSASMTDGGKGEIPTGMGSAGDAEAFIAEAHARDIQILISLSLSDDTESAREKLFKQLRYWRFLGADGLWADIAPHLASSELMHTLHTTLKTENEQAILVCDVSLALEETLTRLGPAQGGQYLVHPLLNAHLLMAIKQENKKSLVNLLNETPVLPAGQRWIYQLRDHNPLLLDPLPSTTQKWLLSQYDTQATDQIESRLMPLLEGHKGQWLIFNAILASLPGGIALYYGEEIGMGDGDKNGQSRLMQWGNGKNGLFSESANTIFPVNEDKQYGYHVINVAEQDKDPESLLNATRFLIQVRQNHLELQRGELTLWDTTSRAVLGYWRTDGSSRTLCLYNLSSEVQSVYLYFPDLKGRLVDLLHEGKWWSLENMIPPVLKMRPYASHWLFVETENGTTDGSG